jgi:hypothetical protein
LDRGSRLQPGKQKPDKVPFQSNGKHVSTKNSSTWTTFAACCAEYERGGFDGIGLVFDGKTDADGLCIVGADFDRCIEDGKLVEPARSRIVGLQTYTEVSVSGTGVHCIVRAKPDTTIKDTHAETGRSVEIYSGRRFFTFTGKACSAIRAAVDEVDALIEEVRAAKAHHDQTKTTSQPTPTAKDDWFIKLTPEQKDAAVHLMLSAISTNPVRTDTNPAGVMVLEHGANGGDNDMWFKLITSIAVSGAPHVEDYFVEFASKAKDADSEEALRAKFRDCARLANGQITLGTLIHYARQAGVDLSQRALAARGWLGFPAVAFRDFQGE